MAASGSAERAPGGSWPLLAAFMATLVLALAAGATNAVAALRLRPAEALWLRGQRAAR